MGSALHPQRRSKRNAVDRDARAAQLKAASTAIETANRKPSEEFVEEYLQPRYPILHQITRPYLRKLC